MTPGDLVPHLLALLVYPGGLVTLLLGVVAEAAATLALDGGGPRAALLAPLAGLRRAALEIPLPLVATGLLAVVAATQLAAPFSPVPPVERNLLVALVPLAAVAWLGWARAWSIEGARWTLLAQGCWLVALLTPALLSESLRPQSLGAVVVPADLPLKAAAALLGLLCLPALLQVAPARTHASAVRPLLWLPLCGLYASVFFPPGGDDLAGLLWFLGLTAGTAAVTIGLALLAARRRVVPTLYPRLLVPLALAVLVIAAVTSSST